MDPLENNPPAHQGDTREQIESLRYQMNLIFGSLLIASCILAAFLGVQAHRASMDLLDVKNSLAASTQMIKQDNVTMGGTYESLKEFARTHPDFDKVVLSNFRPNTNSAPAQPAKK